MRGIFQVLLVSGLLVLVFGVRANADAQQSARGYPIANWNIFTTVELENFEDSDSTFDAHLVELFVSAQLNSRLSGAFEIEYENAQEVGEEDGGTIEVEQAWMQFDMHQLANLRTGIILVPFGKYNVSPFDPVQDLTSKPLVMRRVIPVAWAEPGAGLVGSVFPSGRTMIDYQVFVMNGLNDDISDRGLRSARGSFEQDNNNNKAVGGRVVFWIGRQSLGVSGYQGSYDGEGNKITGVDLDASLVFGPLEIKGELASFNLDDGLNADGEEVPDKLAGAYVQAALHFWFDFLNNTMIGRDLESPTFTAVVRWGFAENADDGDDGGAGAEDDNRETRSTFGLNFRPVEEVVFKVEYQINNTDEERLERGDSNGVLASATAVF